jgi:hypothetical protein
VAELRQVSGPPSRTERNVWKFVALVLAAILLAVLKPWGSGSQPASIGAAATSVASATPGEPSAAIRRSSLSDFLTFGTNEPPPGWELWPAGNLASFYFAMRIDMAPIPAAVPSGSPSATRPSPSVLPTDAATSIPVAWPTIRIPAGSTLDLVGINHPIGEEVVLSGLERIDGISGQPVHAVLAISPWPDHFTIIAVATDAADTLGPWPPGHYRLDLRIGPAGLARSVEIIVEPPPGPSASPSPSSTTG